MLAALCVAEEDIVVTVLEQWRGARDEPPAGTGTHFPRSELSPLPQHHGDAAGTLHQAPSGSCSSSPHCPWTEGQRQERQTAKARQSAGLCSRTAPDGTAWMWALISRCQKTPSPILFLLPGLWGAGHNLSPHLHPRARSSAEGWPSSSSRAALGHLAGDAEPPHSPSATPWAWRRAGGACWLFPECWGTSRLGFRLRLLPSTWNKPAVVLVSRRGVDVAPWCWQPSLVLAALPGAGIPGTAALPGGSCSVAAAEPPGLREQGLGGVPVFADDFRVLQIKLQPSPALPRCASSLHPGFSGILVSLLAFPGGCVRAVLKPPNQA